MMAQERISVIIPVYNGEKYVTAAVDSVLSQAPEGIEIIAVDDGSTDGTVERLSFLGNRITVIRQENAGAGAARNRGVENASGDFLCFLDADDLWTEDKLLNQLAVFRENPDVDMVFGHVLQFISPELPEAVKRKIVCPPGALPGFLPGAMMIKANAFRTAGFFETTWRIGEFIDWFIRAGEKGLRHHLSKDIYLKRRLHGNNVGIREKDARTEYVRIVRAALTRRRAREKQQRNGLSEL